MSIPPTYHFKQLGTQAQMMSRNCGNERLAMILEYVALGSMIDMTGITATRVLRDSSVRPTSITVMVVGGRSDPVADFRNVEADD